MTTSPVILMDSSGVVLGMLTVTTDGDRFTGTVGWAADSAGTELFRRFEAIVEGQCFSRLDDVEQEIVRRGFLVRFSDGRTLPAFDLQIYPSRGTVSFAVSEAAHRPTLPGLATPIRIPTPSDTTP